MRKTVSVLLACAVTVGALSGCGLSEARDTLSDARGVLSEAQGLLSDARDLPDQLPGAVDGTDGGTVPDGGTSNTAVGAAADGAATSTENGTSGTEGGTSYTADGGDGGADAGTSGTTAGTLDEYGSYDSRDDVAAYLSAYGHLPDNYITKSEARALGWNGGSVEKYAPGKCIGGDRFGNREGNLPDGHTYTECDIDTLGASGRGAKRIVFSEDMEIYYTDDHYETFQRIYPTYPAGD